MYRDEYHPQIKKDLKKLDPEIRDIIKTKYVPNILSTPEIGEYLVGDLKGIRSYHFKIGNQEFRIAYIVDDDLKQYTFLWLVKEAISIVC